MPRSKSAEPFAALKARTRAQQNRFRDHLAAIRKVTARIAALRRSLARSASPAQAARYTAAIAARFARSDPAAGPEQADIVERARG